jgi:hypothetical protein
MFRRKRDPVIFDCRMANDPAMMLSHDGGEQM